MRFRSIQDRNKTKKKTFFKQWLSILNSVFFGIIPKKIVMQILFSKIYFTMKYYALNSLVNVLKRKVSTAC